MLLSMVKATKIHLKNLCINLFGVRCFLAVDSSTFALDVFAVGHLLQLALVTTSPSLPTDGQNRNLCEKLETV